MGIMKKIILLLLVCTLGFVTANAQEQKQRIVTSVVGPNEAGGFKWSYTLDLGELGKYKIKQGGKTLKTKYSYAFLINLMRKNGWTYVDKIVHDRGVIYFIFEKKVNSDDEIKEGFELELETEVIIN